ncbi:MAG: biopolymer transporter ExbD, partial [Pseudomonadota bacterium]|nr:biopolymer transporter ExbD [Pseudomonadota bacterium]
MRRVRKSINQINVVPYIDVMLVLLVIFMVTAPLVAPGEIQLPTVGSKLTVPVQPLNVRLEGKMITLKDGTNSVRRVTQEQLVESVQAAQQVSDRPVVIEADKNARYQDVLD